MRRVLVDAYNILFTMYEGRIDDFDAARRDLIDMVDCLSRREDTFSTVIFDGSRGRTSGEPLEHSNRIKIIFTGPGISADDTIKEMVEWADEPRDLTVVTSDREIIQYCKSFQTKIQRATGYIERLEKAESTYVAEPEEIDVDNITEKQSGVAEEGVDFWLNYFGEDEEE